MYAARWDIDAVHGHLDTAICQLFNAIGHLDDGPQKDKAEELLDRLDAAQSVIDRLREVLADR